MQTTLKSFSPFLHSTVLTQCLEHSREESEALSALVDNSGDGLPTSITVEGAGFAAVNGVYQRADTFRPDDPMYCKDGFWVGQSVYCFACLPGVGITGVQLWYISFDQPGREEFDVYAAYPFSNHRLRSSPRMNGWEAIEPVNEPAPSLTYNFNN